jgi:hypothetical protein
MNSCNEASPKKVFSIVLQCLACFGLAAISSCSTAQRYYDANTARQQAAQARAAAAQLMKSCGPEGKALADQTLAAADAADKAAAEWESASNNFMTVWQNAKAHATECLANKPGGGQAVNYSGPLPMGFTGTSGASGGTGYKQDVYGSQTLTKPAPIQTNTLLNKPTGGNTGSAVLPAAPAAPTPTPDPANPKPF